jgi:GABA(A) receptor-associated protein
MSNLEKYNLFISKPLEERKSKSDFYLRENPERIPVFMVNKKPEFQIDRLKFLIPKSYKIQSLLNTIRNSNKFSQDEAFYISSNKKILNVSKEIGAIYDEDKNEDGFLYLEITNIVPFGI